ncbi:GABA transporter 1-like [Chenopodium quinoa]|uniref:GABA transporter 1-like n=1 Tax=Chenopodium quinoa TaxID=63459 RepID=UPI000B76D5BC|nr:GABA transporter 1-like [Chenopodium quinoa]
MAHDILGPRWGRYIVGPVQFAVCYGAVVGACLIGGQCIKAIYLLFNPNGTMKLYEFIIIFGGLMLILAQMPSFHSLRHINLISLLLCLGYSAAATVGSVYIGHKSKGPEKDYSLVGNSEDRLFGVFNAIAIIATTFGNGIIPEIQATLAPPVKGKMFKGLSVCYSVVSMTFFSVAVSGYWAFGNQAEGQILSNFVVNGNPFLPKWFIFYDQCLCHPSNFCCWCGVIGSVAAVRQIILDAKSYKLFANNYKMDNAKTNKTPMGIGTRLDEDPTGTCMDQTMYRENTIQEETTPLAMVNYKPFLETTETTSDLPKPAENPKPLTSNLKEAESKNEKE